MPDWVAMAGEHGEFELVFTIPVGGLREFFDAAGGIGWVPRQIGHVVPECWILVPGADGLPRQIETTSLRNLSGLARRDVPAYLEALRGIAGAQQRPTPS
jgi:thiamine-monophosphate kinase